MTRTFGLHRIAIAQAGLTCVLTVAGAALENITIAVPDGTSNHGNPDLLCTPAGWTDVAVFLVGNYLAHAATVVSFPGESLPSTILLSLCALLFPTSGIFRAIIVIMAYSAWGKTDLQKAARTRALCMVVRTEGEWTPRPGDTCHDAILESPPTMPGRALSPNESGSSVRISVFDHSPFGGLSVTDELTAVKKPGFAVHGTYKLPDGYHLAHVDLNVDFEDETPAGAISALSSSHNVIGALIALGQACFALFTLYQTRGDQLERYGYAAFGLTVVPFAIMSIFNLAANAASPSYDTVYLVASSVMDEAAKREGFYIRGLVGRLKEKRTATLESDVAYRKWVNRVSIAEDADNSGVSAQIQHLDDSSQDFAVHLPEHDDSAGLESGAIAMTKLRKTPTNNDEESRPLTTQKRTEKQMLADASRSPHTLYVPSYPRTCGGDEAAS